MPKPFSTSTWLSAVGAGAMDSGDGGLAAREECRRDSAVIIGKPDACGANRSAVRPPHPVGDTRSAMAVCHCAT